MKSIKISKELVRNLIKKRKLNSNKYDYGHVLILAGSRGMTGAAVLSANACIRTGAGLVTLGLPLSQQSIVAKKVLPEVMTLPLEETSKQTLSEKAYKKIKEFIEKRKVNVVGIGPGLSRNNSTKKLVKKIIKNFTYIPVVVDADGLNAVKERDLKNSSGNIILTPHPGELARIINVSSKEIQQNKLKITKNFAKKNNIVCILKGYKSVVSDGYKVFVNTTGNPGMATAGSGDVLTGIVSAFISQVKGKTLKEKLLNSSIVSVYFHGLAGDIATGEKTQIGLIASDIIEKVPVALRSILKNST